MRSKSVLIAIGLIFCCTGCTVGQFKANQSVAQANTQQGVNYLLGRGVAQNNEQAFHYFHQAALEADAFAQNEVAYLYAAGKGTPQNYQKAFHFYKKAAEQGLASAQYNLGLLYENGLGTEPNRAEAKAWIQKAAMLGFEPALLALKKYAT